MAGLFNKLTSIVGLKSAEPQLPPVTDLLPPAPEECLSECSSCPDYPRSFWKAGVERDTPLYGGVKKWDLHVLVATGRDNWMHDVEEEGGVLTAVGKAIEASGMKIKLSACNLPLPPHDHDDPNPPTSLLFLPSWIHVSPHPLHLPPTPPTPPIPSYPPLPTPISITPIPQKTLILLCSHTKRDARCGISAPILRQQFAKHLGRDYRDLHDGREGGAKVVYINHVGGHKFAGNVIIYGQNAAPVPSLSDRQKTEAEVQGEEAKLEQVDRSGQYCIWYARVLPAHCEAIVKYTVGEGRVIVGDTGKDLKEAKEGERGVEVRAGWRAGVGGRW
ncbi:hypothetical protein BJ508DRAFT_329846 [Ascobolus immersus RN42]|uniref:Sucraseferredoxin-like protein n=1 Tax=Ascobolus immersus RN42 TaxID=1160509 RepID=A0A3N4HVK7_ASCIM|nr:hypothetical protein BJ508DRAFT_329846 [Ascobolus immersus RN42]